MKSIERINVSVIGDAKQILIDYQSEHNIRDQGQALAEILIKFKEYEDENNTDLED